jgi:hypothetical protein
MALKLAPVITSPRLYVAWACLVVLALTYAYLTDPYIFGATALVLAGVSTLTFICGISVVLLGNTPRLSGRAWIIGAVSVTAAALGAAFRLLGSFNWA